MQVIQKNTPWYEIQINYYSISGGTNNLQTATLKNMQGNVLKVFKSKKMKAKKYAENYIKKLNLSLCTT